MKTQKNLPITIAGAGCALLAPAAFAGPGGGVITFGPLANIPTVSGTMLVMLALLMAAIGVRLLRSQSSTAMRSVIWAAALGAVASGVGGLKLISDARAALIVNTVLLEQASGGQVSVPPGPTNVVNATDTTLRIIALTANPGCSFAPPLNGGIPLNGGVNGGNGGGVGNAGGPFVGTCSDDPSTVLEAGASCETRVACEEDE